MNRHARAGALVAALMITWAGPAKIPAARAQAYLRWDQAARPAAMGGAAQALSDDPSAVFFSPAGIVHIPGTAVQAGGFMSVDEARFRAFGGGAFDRDESPAFEGSIYLTHTVAERLTAGLGVNSPWGLSVEWTNPNAFIGRFRAVENHLGSIQFNPVLAYGPAGPWSAALGIDVLSANMDWVRFEQDPALSALGGTEPIDLARTEIESDGTGVGWNAAVLYRPSERFSAGAQYRGEIDLDVNGRADFTIVAPDELRAILLPGREVTVGALLDARYVDQLARSALTFPAIAVLGATYRPVDQLRVAADVQWTGWSQVDSLALAFSDTALAEGIALGYENAWSARWGAELEVRPGLQLRIGYAWHESPVPTASVTPLVPDAGRDSYSAGVGFHLGGTAVDLAYRLTRLDDREGVAFPENAHSPDGIYESVSHRIGISLSRRL